MNDQTELEQEIIASILTKPELFRVVRISERWFTNPDYKIVFEAISKSGGSFSSIFEIAKIILDMGYEQISVSRLTEIKNSIATTEHFRSKVQLLETSYLETNLRELSFEYSKSPRTETLSAMVDYAMLLQSKSVKSESGSMVEVINQYEKNLYEDLPDRTIKTYWQFDNAFGGLYPGMLFTIGARPGVGKTAFAVVNLVLKALHRNQGLSVDIFTLEMQRRELLLRYASNLTGINGYERTIYEVVNSLRKKGVPVCAKRSGEDRGYFIAQTEEERIEGLSAYKSQVQDMATLITQIEAADLENWMASIQRV
ncbi:hypothetical protein CF160_07250 [Enterococcus pseudoavium]|nr:hypothetical protein CF160_07250 [Enterococcus pseudoavium]